MEQQKKTFALKLKGLAPWISQIQYEKEEQDLILRFTLSKKIQLNIIVEDEGSVFKRLTPPASFLGPLSQKLILNVEYRQNLDLYITSLVKKDFQECRATPLALKSAMEELKQYGAENSSLLILFETPTTSQGLLWSTKPKVRSKIKALKQGIEKGNWVLFAVKEPLISLKDSLTQAL